MKTQSFLILAVLIMPLCGYAHWEVQNPRPTFQDLTDVCMVTPDIGYAVGMNGTIIKTTDGGIHWELLNSNVTDYLVALSFADALTGFAVGIYYGNVIKTTDGGENWYKIAIGPDVRLNDIRMVSANEGWAVGSAASSGKIFHTSDGGITWETQYTQLSSSISKLCFADETHGWALASGSGLLNTVDGGVTWDMKFNFDSVFTEGYMSDIYFSDPLNGWATGYDYGNDLPIIARTSDGGTAWNTVAVSGAPLVYSGYSMDSLQAWVAGAGIFHTGDGGATWEAQLTGYNSNFAGISSCDGTHLLAVGSVGIALSSKDGGINWNPSSGSATFNNLNKVCFPGPAEGWSIGSAGTIIHTVDKGDTWERQTSGTNRDLWSVAFTDTLHGWVAGDTGTILHTSDGGTSWLAQTSGSLRNFRAISFTDNAHGWVAGDSGTILHTPDGGTTWENQQSNSPASLVSLSFPDSLHGWAAGNTESGLVLLHTNDGGTAWLEQGNTGINGPNGATQVFFTDSLHGWWMLSWNNWGGGGPDGNTAYYAPIKYTTDGGKTWADQSINGEGLAIYFKDSLNGWIILRYCPRPCFGECYNTRNGGQTWEKLYDLPWLSVQDVVFTDINNGWIVGSNGIVLHTNHAGIVVSSNLKNKTVCINDSIAFVGTANGPPPVLFQWQKNSIDIPGATGMVYAIACALAGDSGSYRYYASNAYGSDTSNTVLLNVHYFPPAKIDGDTVVAPYQAETYSVVPDSGHFYYFSCTGGNMIDLTDTSITVHWGNKSPGLINLHETDELWCHGDSIRLEILIRSLGQEEIPDCRLRITNWPNPFGSSTTLYYLLDGPSPVTLQIFNSYGCQVYEQFFNAQANGGQKTTWHSENLPPGMYYCRIRAGNIEGTGKMVKI